MSPGTSKRRDSVNETRAGNRLPMNTGRESGGGLNRVVAEARRRAALRERDYRRRAALKMYPWTCGRRAREIMREILQELVHTKLAKKAEA